MNNRFRAAQLITGLHEIGFHNPQDLAKYLDETGLITPDLPEPTLPFSDGTKAWFVKDDEEGYCIGATYIFDGEILLRTAAGRVKGAPAKMRKIGLALLAAANHTEEEA